MKKLFIYFCISTFILTVQAQTWKTVKLDSVVSVKLPFSYQAQDTLGQKILTSTSAHGNIQILVTPDHPQNTPDIEKERHLIRYYNDYLKKIKLSSSGIISHETDTTINNLRVKDFTLEVDSGSGKQLRAFRILHENCATYTFQFLYQGIHADVAQEERTAFFNSIEVANNAALQSQFTSKPLEAAENKSRGYLLPAIGIGILLLLLLIFLLRLRRNRSRLHS